MRKKLLFIFFTMFVIPCNSYGINFDWIEIGDIGNTPDTHGGYGGVNYEYQISKYEVTNAQYIAFLNAIAKDDTNNLYNANMSGAYGGISRIGTLGNYQYQLKNNDVNWANKPVVYVSLYDCYRFANWIYNGQIYGAQNALTTEDGVYDLINNNINRGSGSGSGLQIFVPTREEWYKAAYYDAAITDYYDYATSSSGAPNNNDPTNDTGNSVNYRDGVRLAIGVPYYFNDVGAYAATTSPYGTYDQNGNAYEWTETLFDTIGLEMDIFGGSFDSTTDTLTASYEARQLPMTELYDLGFRLASDKGFQEQVIPEPFSFLMLLMGVLSLLAQREHGE